MSTAKRPGGVTAALNEAGSRKFRKGDRSRRMWTLQEEETLATILDDLVARGWKSDNGFRSGYLRMIENAIRAEFPKSDLKGTPHITSKIQAWKKDYNSLRRILGRAGVGFNPHGDYKIDCDDEQWEQIVAADKNAKFMRHKSWPFWETWKCIFGEDRACGGGAEELDTAAEETLPQEPAQSQCNENDYRPPLDDVPTEANSPVEEQADLPGNDERQTYATKTRYLKRKNGSSDDALMEFLGNLHAETNSRLEAIAARIGYEFDLGQARQAVFDKLGTVDGLTLDERYELCDILSDKSQRLEVFMGMPANARLGYVKRFLK